MDTEPTLFAAILAAGCLPLAVALTRGKPRVLRLVGLGLAILIPVALAWPLAGLPRPPEERDVRGRPIQVVDDPYVSSDRCQSCHPGEYATWHASFHRVMTRVATPENVIGTFEGQVETLFRREYRLGRDGDTFWVEMDDPEDPGEDGTRRRVRREIVMTTGRHHVQVYWSSTGVGRSLTLVPIVWLVEAQRWVPRQSTFLRPPHTGMVIEVGRWNTGCIKCHTTAGQSRPEDGEFDSHVREFGIACEACHGPAHEHVAANRDPVHRYRQHFGADLEPAIVDPAALAVDRSSQVCGQCHSAWSGHHENHEENADVEGTAGKPIFHPGDDLLSQRVFIQTVAAAARFNAQGSFWPDDQIRVAGREYNSLLKSACYNHGDPEKARMSCLSCHEMHPEELDESGVEEWRNDQLRPGMRGNEACLGCHETFRDRVEEHTHHPASSTGSLCYNCHMSHTTYGLLKAVRSHTIEIPSVATSVDVGRPNACNQCHLDQTLAWTAERLEDWYGQPKPRLDSDQRRFAASVLWALRGDAAQRALMAWSFGWKPAQEASGTSWMLPFLVELMNDPYDTIRYMGHRSLRTLPGYENVEYDFLSTVDERRSVQAEVQRIWMSGPQPDVPGERLLLVPGGGLRTGVFHRLIQERDPKPTVIIE